MEYKDLTDEQRNLVDELQYVDMCLQKRSKADEWDYWRKERERLTALLKEEGINF